MSELRSNGPRRGGYISGDAEMVIPVVPSGPGPGSQANADDAAPLLAEVTRLRTENAELRARIDGVLSLCDAQDEADLRPDPPDFEPHSIAWTTVVRAALAEPLGSTPDPPAEGRSE